MAGYPVSGDLYWELDGKLWEIKRQLRQPSGYPFDPGKLNDALQWVIEGKFMEERGGVVVPVQKPVVASRDFPVWKTVKLGTGLKTADDFRKAFATQGCKISNWANDILGKPAFMASETEIEADLVRVSVAELGFKKGARYDEICARGKEFGLGLCPNEVGPQLRLQYPDQPPDERLIVAMEPISGSDGDPGVWDVGRCESGLWLSAGCGYPAFVWHSHLAFLFCRPRK